LKISVLTISLIAGIRKMVPVISLVSPYNIEVFLVAEHPTPGILTGWFHCCKKWNIPRSIIPVHTLRETINEYPMTGTKKSTGKMFSLGITIAMLFLMTTAIIPGVYGANPVDLKTADNFAVLATSAITDTLSLSVITGDVGLSPTTGAGIVGFDSCTQVAGAGRTIYKINAAGPLCATNNPTLVGNAVADMISAYSAANSGPADFPVIGGENIGGRTLIPGNYSWTGAVTMGDDVTLDGQGDANAVWIFRTTGDLTVGAGKKIILSRGAQPGNIFWTVAGYTELGANSVFKGNILGAGYITLNNGAALNGRALAQTAVTLENNPVTVPVLRVEPVAVFSFIPISGTAPLTVAFTDSSTFDPTSVTNNSWAWDFNGDTIIDNTTRNPVFVYDTPGVYTPKLTVTDSFGAVASSSQLDTVTVYQPPVADFTFTPAHGPAYFTVAFTDTSHADPLLSIHSWAWDFENDGTVDNTTRNPVYTYYSAGAKTVNLTVTDSFGAVATKLDTVTVDPPVLSINVNGPLVLALNADQTTTNTDIQFNVTSTTNWQVTAYDADASTSGFMTDYVSAPPGYVPANHLIGRFMVRQNADNLYVDLPTSSSTAMLIQTGTPEDSGTVYPLGVQQDVKLTDPRLSGDNEYRIVVTLTAIST
jgi:PKD repeat protein